MATLETWKDEYFYNGLDFANTLDGKKVIYHSVTGLRNGNGSRSNPYNILVARSVDKNGRHILSAGRYQLIWGGDLYARDVMGQGCDQTILVLGGTFGGQTKFIKVGIVGFLPSASENLQLDQCALYADAPSGITFKSITKSKIYTDFSRTYSGSRNSFFKQTRNSQPTFSHNLSLQCESEITITQDILNSYQNNWLAFDDCRFRIGNEADYSALTGETAEDLRTSFVARCTAQNLTVPNLTELNETLPMGRWIFATKSTSGGCVIKNSMIDDYQTKRLICFGYSADTVVDVPIRTVANVPNSINLSNPKTSKVILEDKKLSLATTFDVLNKESENVLSNIIWLGGGVRQLTSLNILENFIAGVGFNINVNDTVGTTATKSIEEGNLYIVRSTDGNESVIKYNNTNYSSSLAGRNSIFWGVAGAGEFTVVSGNPAVYPVNGFPQYQIVGMRTVQEIPTQKITSGSLQSGYWYIVSPNNLNDTGTVKYKGVEYPPYASFLVSDDLTFSVQGDCHLRRCWRNDYAVETEVTDKAFWNDKQKPLWCRVIPSDLRCLMVRNTMESRQMLMDGNGEYITSGHPRFFDMLQGVNGQLQPAFPMVGAYVQINLRFTTKNAM